MTTYSPGLDELSAAVESALVAWLEAHGDEPPDAPFLVDEIRRCVRAGGKRLRPAFCYWGFRTAGAGHRDEAVTAAAALELLHTFALVHDDIMDRAAERRGQPTTYAEHGLDAAILVGDLALVLADEMLLTSGFPCDTLAPALLAYARMRRHVIAGQHLDVSASSLPAITVAQARRIAVLKAGMYTVEEPLLIGATLGGAQASLLEALSRFGRPLGEAFQLRDDLLSTFGDASGIGKPVDSDIRQGKRNLLFAEAAGRLRGEQRAFLLGRWGAADLTEQEVEALRDLLETSGARAATEALHDELVARARAALSELPVNVEVGAALADLVERVARRAL